MIYLDHNATTPVDERVLEAMLPFLSTFFGNPSGLYRLGRIVRSAIDQARQQLADLVSVSPEQIIFTSGGTEANHLALSQAEMSAQLWISAIEHPSVLETAKRYYPQFSELLVDVSGKVEIDQFAELNFKENDFISVMSANNETGVVQDIASLTASVKQQGVIFHTDAVQALGKIPLSFNDLGVQLMSLSSHKIYGPKGSGALVFEKGFNVQPVLVGGGQEFDCRSGTENVAGIVGFGKAAELAKQAIEEFQTILTLRDCLEQQLALIPGVVIFARDENRLPNTVQFAILGVDGEMLLMQLDRNNIAVSSGSACASGGGEVSSVLLAMGVDPQLAKGAIRVSLGRQNTESDIEAFIVVLKEIISQI